MLQTRLAFLCALAIVFGFGSPASAAKADWPGTHGRGVIGFGLVELTPGSYLISYNVPGPQAANLESGQVAVFPASAIELNDNIPLSAAVAYFKGASTGKDGSFDLGRIVRVEAAGLYVIAYGPYDGLVIFDQPTAGPYYKITARPLDGGSARWIDEDAGDFTVSGPLRNPSVDSELVFRLRMVRNRDSYLGDSSLYKIQPFKLHPAARTRVKLLDANW